MAYHGRTGPMAPYPQELAISRRMQDALGPVSHVDCAIRGYGDTFWRYKLPWNVPFGLLVYSAKH